MRSSLQTGMVCGNKVLCVLVLGSNLLTLPVDTAHFSGSCHRHTGICDEVYCRICYIWQHTLLPVPVFGTDKYTNVLQGNFILSIIMCKGSAEECVIIISPLFL